MVLLGIPSLPGKASAPPLKDNPLLQSKASPLSERWKKWLDEIKPIMTSAELAVFKQLETEEDRMRFQTLFWKARDPNSQKPEIENEYKKEFYRRLQAAERNYGGGSDRARMYIILGKPSEIMDFSGSQNLTECQLWVYNNDNRPGFLPFVNLIFFRQRDMGDYRLFYPGIHTARDLLDPNAYAAMTSSAQAYQFVASTSSELAGASLSVIPGEGDVSSGISSSSSTFAFSKIFSLPGNEARSGYLIGFTIPQGLVQVSSSTQEIKGWGHLALSVHKDILFLNIAVMPAGVHMTPAPDERFKADIRIYIRVEDRRGNSVYQDERKIPLHLSAAQKKDIDAKRIIFHDFIPMIPGDFLVRVTFMNKDSDEFFTHEEIIVIPENPLPVLTGFKINDIRNEGFVSFAMDKFLLFNDPRLLFNPNDSLEGIVMSEAAPDISINGVEGNKLQIQVKDIQRQDRVTKFSQPLTGLEPGKYLLSVKTADGRSFSQTINLEPADLAIPKPMAFEKTEPASARDNFLFVLAQEHLNSGQVEKALGLLSRLPETLLNSTTLPVIGRAYYLNHDHARALVTLEKEPVEKNYAVLLILANSAIELKKFRKAVDYLERVRKYGDSSEINYSLAAAYLSLGDKNQAKAYLDHARELEKKEK